MKEGLRNSLATVGLGLCLLVVAISWPLMKFGGLITELDFPTSDYSEWITSAYVIAEVAMVPIAGKIIDHIGLKRIIPFGFTTFAIFAIACVYVDNLREFAICRVFQGIGAGICFSCAFTSPGILYPHGERAMPHEIMTAAFAIGSLFGAAAGVYLAVEMNWKYIFYIPAILCFIGGMLAWLTLPKQKEIKRDFDFPGVFFLFLLLFFGMAYTQTVDKRFEMFSMTSGLYLLFLILLAKTFYDCERKAKNPVFPHSLRGFQLKIMLAILFIAIAVLGLLQFFVKVYIIKYSNVLETIDLPQAIYGGCGMFAFLLLGGACSSIPGGHKVPYTGVRPWCVFGCLMVTIGLILTVLIVDKGLWCMALCLYVLGLGLGAMITELLISLQALTPREDMGVTSSLTMGMRVMAIAIGLTVYTQYSNQRIIGLISSINPEFNFEEESFLEIFFDILVFFIDSIDGILDVVITSFRECAGFAIIFCVAGLVLSYFMRDLDKGLCGPAPVKKHRFGKKKQQ